MRELSTNKETASLTFVSLNQSQYLEMSKLTEVVVNFLAIFDHTFIDEEKVLRVEPLQQHTFKLDERFSDFLKVYAKDFPQFNIFRSFFRELPQGHYFMIVNGKINDTAQIMNAFTFLTHYHLDRGIAQPVDVKYFDTRGALEHYNLSTFGHQHRTMGKWVVKHKRICRFCQQTNGEKNRFGYIVSFKNKSHSIAEALGNRKVFTSDECDGCNDRFSMGIEPSLITFLSVFRSMHGLNGKNGMKTLKGENFILDPVQGLSIELNETHEEILQRTELSIDLKLKDKFIPQNIYRCLVKFVLGVIDEKLLSELSTTLLWVNGETDVNKLPSIAMHQGANFFKKEPVLLYYLRKDDSELPKLIGEFHYADIIFVFIVPISSADHKIYSKKKAFMKFWNIFNLTRSQLQWDFREFHSIEPKSIAVNFNFKGMNAGENIFVVE